MFIRLTIVTGGFPPIPTSNCILNYISELIRILRGQSCGTILVSTVLPWTVGIPAGISVSASVTLPGEITGDGTAGTIRGDGITLHTGGTDTTPDGGITPGTGIIIGITVTGIHIIREDVLIGDTLPSRISDRITRQEHTTRTIGMPEVTTPTPVAVVTLRTAGTTTKVGDLAIKAPLHPIPATIAAIREATATPTERVPPQGAEATRARENIKKPDVENNFRVTVI